MGIIIIAVLAIIFLLLWACIRIVPQAEARVIERLGVFHAVWNAGIHVKIPVIDRAVIPHIDLREQVLELTWSYNKGTRITKELTHDMQSTDRTGTSNREFDANASATGFINAFGSLSASAHANLSTGTKGSWITRKNSFRSGGVVYDAIGSNYYSDFRDVITKDNVKMYVDAAVFYQVTDPKQYAYGMKQPLFALHKLAVTNLRNIIGTLELDETLSSRDLINTKLRVALDEATDSWGIKITRVEIESILPPPQIQEAMEMQVTAERTKRAVILKAEGEKQATILLAEAKKREMILEAEAIEQAAILKAKGEAEAYLEMKQAEAESLKVLNENAPNDAIIRLKAIQGMENIADGQATKILIPTEMAGLVGLANGLTEGVTPGTPPVIR